MPQEQRTAVSHIFTQEGIFFSQVAVVTFGGAYAVLAYIAQEAVATYGWHQPGEMIDGLGMAETTPGPLVRVVQFVGWVPIEIRECSIRSSPVSWVRSSSPG